MLIIHSILIYEHRVLLHKQETNDGGILQRVSTQLKLTINCSSAPNRQIIFRYQEYTSKFTSKHSIKIINLNEKSRTRATHQSHRCYLYAF